MYLQIENLTHRYGAHKALDDVSFSITAGERLCLLGPSGCGKTTTLQAIAGFITPAAGAITVKGERLNEVPSEKRNIGIMFQNYALFPHMTVHDNIAFGLRMQSVERQEVRQRVGEALEVVRLSHKANQLPGRLSGGEQQRIAFARAVVIRPRLLLLDEPFSNLDARLRLTMRNELLDLLKGLSIATLMVTHDQEEAMAVGDKIAVMRAGRIRQIGTPVEVYEAPANRFVAEFLGESNIFAIEQAQPVGSRLEIMIGDGKAIFADAQAARTSDLALVRPEHMEILPANASTPPDSNRLPGVVEQILFLGHRVEATVRTGVHTLKIWTLPSVAHAFKAGDEVSVVWPVVATVIVDGADV